MLTSNITQMKQTTKADSRRNKNINRPITGKDSKLVIKKLPTQKSQGLHGFTGCAFKE